MTQYVLEPKERRRVHEEQRRRACALIAAMGIKSDVSANQAAKIIEVLSPFVPGLSIESPTTLEAVPHELNVPWLQPMAGRRREWTSEALLSLLSQHDELSASGKKRLSIYREINAQRSAAGVKAFKTSTLDNLLTEARKLRA